MPVDIAAIAPGVSRGSDGIWYAQDTAEVSYPDYGHDAAFAIEDSSFWFQHRNNCIAAVVKQFPPPSQGPIFDIGGGNGFVTRGLVDRGFEAVLVEPGPVGASNARRRGVEHVVCASTDTANFVRGSLAGVGLFDVIEHVEDDDAFVRSIRHLVQPGGMLYATVPAYNALWSDEDIDAGHFRRHTAASISKVVSDAGFDVLFTSYIFRFLPLPILLLRALPYRLGMKRQHATAAAAERDHATGGGLMSTILDMALRSEVRNLMRGERMRFGGSILLAARACR